MNEHKLQRDVARAAQAKALLENELVAEAFARLDADYLAAWRGSGPRDGEARERLWLAIQVLGKVREHLGLVVVNGRLAQAELNQLVRQIDQLLAEQRESIA